MRSVGVLLLATTARLVIATQRSLLWVGDVWIPPNGKLYTIDEIQKTFERRRVLVLGDSLARRFTASLALILGDVGSNDLLDSDVDQASRLGRGGHGHYDWPVLSGRLRYQWTPRARDVASYVHKADLSDYTDVIVAIGVHDAENPSSVPFEDDVKSALNALQSSAATVVWRTAPNMDNPWRRRRCYQLAAPRVQFDCSERGRSFGSRSRRCRNACEEKFGGGALERRQSRALRQYCSDGGNPNHYVAFKPMTGTVGTGLTHYVDLYGTVGTSSAEDLLCGREAKVTRFSERGREACLEVRS